MRPPRWKSQAGVAERNRVAGEGILFARGKYLERGHLTPVKQQLVAVDDQYALIFIRLGLEEFYELRDGAGAYLERVTPGEIQLRPSDLFCHWIIWGEQVPCSTRLLLRVELSSGIEMIIVENRVEYEEVAALRITAPQCVVAHQYHVAFA